MGNKNQANLHSYSSEVAVNFGGFTKLVIIFG